MRTQQQLINSKKKMPRSFLVKKHLSNKKPNYGILDSKVDELHTNLVQPEVLCYISSTPWLPGQSPIHTPASMHFPEVNGLSLQSPRQETTFSLTYLSHNNPLSETHSRLETLETMHGKPIFLPSQDFRHLEERDNIPTPLLGLPTGVIQERFECLDCHKAYFTFSGLAKHRQLHCQWQCHKYFSCKYCEKEYVSLGALKMHIRTHTLPCVCKLCGKAFSRPWLLQGHIRTHTGEKPFSCPHCSRAFADRSNLRAHLQTHSDIKKYHCKSCSKTFSRISLLSKHEETGCCPLS